MKLRFSRRFAALLVGFLALFGGVTAGTAIAVDGNPWSFVMNNQTGDGLVLVGSDGTNSNILLVKDHLNQPIFSVLKAGGASVLGDDFRVMSGADPLHGQVTISPLNPNSAMCVRGGQLWIGGPNGGIWRCADLDGTGPSPLAWWPTNNL